MSARICRTVGRWLLLGIAIVPAACGCAKVDATSDFQRAGEVIGQHTGVDEDLAPQSEDEVQAKVDALLADGLTLEEAVRIALLNNREFQALFYEIGVSKADLVQAGLLTNPSLGFITRWPEGGGRADIELTIGQELVDLWQIPVRKKVAREQLEQTVLRVSQRAVELRAEVKRSYFELLAARLAYQTAEESVKLVRELLRSTEEQLRAGEVSQLDADLQRLTVLDAELSAIGLGREQRVAQAAFARVLGLSRSDRPLVLASELPRITPTGDAAELIAVALEQRLDARMAESAVRQAEKELTEQYLKIFPSISTGFAMEQLEGRALPSRKILADTMRSSIAAGQLTPPGIQSRAQRKLERRQIVDVILGPSLNVTLPIWDQNQAQIAKAKFRVQQRRREFENVLDTIAQDVQRTLAALQTAESLMRMYEEQALPQVTRTVEGARRVYRSGEAPVVTLVEAQRTLVARRAGFVDVLRAYAVALAELEAAVGGQFPGAAASQPASAPAGEMRSPGEM